MSWLRRSRKREEGETDKAREPRTQSKAFQERLEELV